MKLSAKSQKTLDALVAKSNNDFLTKKSRMPRLSSVSALLDEVGVANSLEESVTVRYGKSSGSTYFTYGGNREYKGYSLRVDELRLNMDSTDSDYSYYSVRYAKELVDLVTKYL